MTTIPVKLSISLKTPVAVSHPWINGDGLVEYLCAVDEYGREFLDLVANSTIQSPQELDLNVPLAEYEGINKASISFFDISDSFSFDIYKRFYEDELEWIESRKTKIRTNSGVYKNDVISLNYYPCSKCDFYFDTTDFHHLKKLFDDIFTGLGKKTSIGFGEVSKIEWEVIEEDKSLVDDGVAMRPIPESKCINCSNTKYLSWKAPYWHEENFSMCAVPGSDVMIR